MSLIRSVKHFVIVGDGRVGKTTLLFTYTNGFYQESTVPTIYDREETSVRFNGEDYPVQFHDTAGQEDYESASRFAYSVADVIILCYAVPERISFENIELKWIPKIIKARPNVPIVLVGTKHDVKTPNFVSVREGEALKRRIKANTLILTSAKTGKNVEKVIQEALEASFTGKIVEKRKCCCFC